MGTSFTPLQNVAPDAANAAQVDQLAAKLRGLAAAATSEEDKLAVRAELREAAEGFEAMLLNQLLKEMMPDEGEGSLFGDGIGSGTYHQLFLNELSSMISKSGQLGLADVIERDVAARAGLTEEWEDRTEPIPGQALGRPLPQPLRRQSFVPRVYRDSAALDRNDFGSQLSFISPLNGRRSSEYGERKDPFTGAHRHHHGVDIAAPEGSPIRAAAPGKVAFSGTMPGYGNVVIIEHAGGYETRYAHNADNNVRKGDTVAAGQVVATVGSTGRSTGPHLHFEVRKDGASVDPEDYMKVAD